MFPRQRHSHHELIRDNDTPPTSPGKRRLSLDHTADQILARANGKISLRSSANAQVQPIGRASATNKSRSSRRLQKLPSLRFVFFKESFFDVYGYLGIAMLIAFFLSFAAMLYLAVVQVIPNWTVNYLMNTEMLDNGEFLLMPKPSQTIVVTSALMMAIFACLYLWLIVFMLSYNDEDTVNNLAEAPNPKSIANRLVQKCLPLIKRLRGRRRNLSYTITAPTSPRTRSFENIKGLGVKLQRTASFGSHTASKLIFDFTSMEGTYHRYYDALLDLPKLCFQTVSLVTYLNNGFPLPIIFFYALPLGFNWLISLYRFERSKPDPGLIVARVFYLFDLFFAVFAPMMMMVYAYYNFHLDRETFTTREETCTPGSFDRIARLFADPIEVEIVKSAFSNLQIADGQYILIKSFLNLLGIYKWKKVIAHLILVNRSRRQDNGATKKCLHPHSRAHTIFSGIIFVCSCLGIAIYTGLSLTTSMENCAPYEDCAVYSYRWRWGQDNSCPCIVFIDRELAPRTYNEWINAEDVTESVRALASNGFLQKVQIINHAMPELPEELRRCKGLKDLCVTLSYAWHPATSFMVNIVALLLKIELSSILIYTKTRRFPDWIKEFTRLQYFHAESDFLHSSLQYLPPDMFTNMSNLRFIRTGGAAELTIYPSLAGLDKLSTLVMTMVHKLKELPNLDDLVGLTTLYVADAIHIRHLPSFKNLKSLKSFALFRRNELCCNGWATGYCDLTNFQCLNRTNEAEVTCVSDRIPVEDRSLIDRIGGFLCGKNITQDVIASEPTLESTDGICQGVLYRECYMHGTRGICYNGRMQVVHCDVYGEYERMRRLQIARNVGDRCDPEVEAWLGCGNTTP